MQWETRVILCIFFQSNFLLHTVTLFSEPQTKTCGPKKDLCIASGFERLADTVLLATKILHFWEVSMIEKMGKAFSVGTPL